MQNAPKEHSAILLTFIKLLFVFKTFVLSIFKWPLKTSLTVLYIYSHTNIITNVLPISVGSLKKMVEVYYNFGVYYPQYMRFDHTVLTFCSSNDSTKISVTKNFCPFQGILELFNCVN